MSLFPAFSVDNNEESYSKALETSYDWLKNLNHHREDEEEQEPESSLRVEPEPSQPSPSENSSAKGQLQPHPTSPLPHKKKKKKRKKKKSRKKSTTSSDSSDNEREKISLDDKGVKKDETKEGVSPGEDSSSLSCSHSPTPDKTSSSQHTNSASTGKRSGQRQSKSESKKRCRSRSKVRSGRKYSKSRSRSPSKGKKTKSKRNRIRSRSRSKSRSQSRQSKSRNRSRTRSRSRSRRRSKSRSRSRSECKQSKSRTRTKRCSKSRRKRSKSRSRSRSESKPSKSRNRSRTRSRSRARGKRSRRRSRSRNKPSSRNRSRSRSVSKGRKSGKLPQACQRGKVEEFVSKSKSVFIADLQGLVKPEQAFYLSTDGDTNNKIFMTTHFSELASYKKKVRGELGSERSKDAKSRSGKKTLRYFKKNALKVLYSDATKIRTLPKNTLESEYLPLNLTYTEEASTKVPVTSQPSEVNPLGIYDSGTEHYLQGLDSGTQEDPPQSSQDIEQEFWRCKSREFNERLGREPSNVSLWLEFVRFQDDAYYILFQDSDDKGTRKKSKKNQRALAERKISILDTAIKKNIRSLELNYERLEIGQEIWDDKKLKQEWDTLIFNFPNNMSVWYHYLVFSQTHLTSFNLPGAVRMFSRCTERLRQMQSGAFLTHIPPTDLGHCLVDVAVQLARVWRQGGHMERAMALFQALVELNLFPPHHVRGSDTPLESKLQFFEPFWDSRAPRFGEKNAVGWAQVMKRKETVEYPEVILEGTRDEEDDLLGQGGTTSHLWSALETSRERRHWLPWEQDPEDCEDPERMVPIDELSPHLFVLQCEEEWYYLILQFVKFFGVPDVDNLMKNTNRTEVRSAFEPLVLETFFNTSLSGSQFCFITEDKRREILNFDPVGPTLQKPWCEEYGQFLCQVVQQAANVFSQFYQQNLTIIYIKLLGVRYHAKKSEAYDKHNLKVLRKEIKKTIKKILKLEDFRMCLPIYQEYGKVEEAMGHLDDASNVYITALSFGTATGNAFDTTNKDFSAINNLYDSYIKIQIQREVTVCSGEHVNNLLYSLCSLITSGKFAVSNGSPTPGGLLLKAKKKLIELQERYSTSLTVEGITGEINDGAKVLTINIVRFMALIQLFTVGFQPACLVYETSIEKAKRGDVNPEPCRLADITLPLENEPKTQGIGDKSQEEKDENGDNSDEEPNGRHDLLEHLYEGYIWLVETSRQVGHLVSGHMSPLAYRELLMAATTAAPHNNKFLFLMAQNQGWRNLVGGKENIDERRKSIVVLISHILPHLHWTLRLLTNTKEGTLSCGHRLESVLDRAVSIAPGKHCPLLWRLYMALVAVTRPTGLKGLAYRALAHCPGVKSVYLDCVRRVPEMLKEVVRLMAEKGLRLRLPLEELQVLTETELEFVGEAEDEEVPLE